MSVHRTRDRGARLPCNRPITILSFGQPIILQLAEPHGYDWPVPETTLYPQYSEPCLTEALADSPVMLIRGPRQCGKTTLTRMSGKRSGYTDISFDDDVARSAAAGESRTLAALRDALLPKLLSGELRINDVGRIVGRQM